MKINKERKWIDVKKLSAFLTNEIRKLKRKGKSPIVLGNRVEGKNGKVTFTPIEIVDVETYKKRKSKKKIKRNKKRKSK